MCPKKSASVIIIMAFMPPFSTGKLITSVVTGIAHRRPQGESYDQAIRNDATGLWQCPFCQQDNFPELSEVMEKTAASLSKKMNKTVR